MQSSSQRPLTSRQLAVPASQQTPTVTNCPANLRKESQALTALEALPEKRLEALSRINHRLDDPTYNKLADQNFLMSRWVRILIMMAYDVNPELNAGQTERAKPVWPTAESFIPSTPIGNHTLFKLEALVSGLYHVMMMHFSDCPYRSFSPEQLDHIGLSLSQIHESAADSGLGHLAAFYTADTKNIPISDERIQTLYDKYLRHSSDPNVLAFHRRARSTPSHSPLEPLLTSYTAAEREALSILHEKAHQYSERLREMPEREKIRRFHWRILHALNHFTNLNNFPHWNIFPAVVPTKKTMYTVQEIGSRIEEEQSEKRKKIEKKKNIFNLTRSFLIRQNAWIEAFSKSPVSLHIAQTYLQYYHTALLVSACLVDERFKQIGFTREKLSPTEYLNSMDKLAPFLSTSTEAEAAIRDIKAKLTALGTQEARCKWLTDLFHALHQLEEHDLNLMATAYLHDKTPSAILDHISRGKITAGVTFSSKKDTFMDYIDEHASADIFLFAHLNSLFNLTLEDPHKFYPDDAILTLQIIRGTPDANLRGIEAPDAPNKWEKLTSHVSQTKTKDYINLPKNNEPWPFLSQVKERSKLQAFTIDDILLWLRSDLLIACLEVTQDREYFANQYLRQAEAAATRRTWICRIL